MAFARFLIAQADLPKNQPLSFLSHFPLLPASPWPNYWHVDFYIDATTRQVFEDYGSGERLAERFRIQVLQRERHAYEHAGVVVCRSQWAADSVISHYGIDSAKVHVVPGAANLDEDLLNKLPPSKQLSPPGHSQPLLLGFLGKDWHRKGGPFLIELADCLQERGMPVKIRVIGPDPASLPRHKSLQPLGFINKQTDTAWFVSELRSWHFGTLFSQAEAFGISNRECLRLGVPVLCHAVGGISSTMPDVGCGKLFRAHPSAGEVADWIEFRLTPYEGYLVWRAALAHRWREFTWDATVNQLEKILVYPRQIKDIPTVS